MTSTQQFPSTATAVPLTSQGQVLKGRYIEPYRSRKGKLKGLMLQVGTLTYCIKLPKYLRPMLVRELEVGAFVQVWGYPEDDIWRAINIFPFPEADLADLRHQGQDASPQPIPVASLGTNPAATSAKQTDKRCIKVCQKGKCYKQGGKKIWKALQAEIDGNPDLQHISLKATGCMKACQKAPNLKVLPKGKIVNRVTPEQALTILSSCR